MPEVELAMSLYHDPELVQHILAEGSWPEGCDRIAIALTHAENSPHLVMSRDGHFVTCLGEGMAPRSVPIMTRRQLDTLIRRADVLRDCLAVSEQALAEGKGLKRLLRRIFKAGDRLSREDFEACAKLHPILAPGYFRHMVDLAIDLYEMQPLLLHVRKPHPRHNDRLRAYWNMLFAVGHLTILSSMGGPSLLNGFQPETRELIGSWSLIMSLHMVYSQIVRGAWFAGRLGKILLPTYKKRFLEADDDIALLDSGVGLMAIASRHTKYMAEVRKALIEQRPANDSLNPAQRNYHNVLTRSIREFLVNPEAMGLFARAAAKHLLMNACAALPTDSPFRFARAEDVPDDLAQTYLCNGTFNFRMHPNTLLLLFAHVPWVARASPELLYYTEEQIGVFCRPWRPEDTIEVLDYAREYQRISETRTHRLEARPPGRNDPCTCGSGKKYKKCCARGEPGKT